MPRWAAATAVYCVYVLACALLVRRVSWRNRACAAIVAALAAALALSAQVIDSFAVRSLLLPISCLVLGYRATGFLWRGPDPRAERVLASTDVKLGIRLLASRTPRVLAELLELAYASVYPLIPIALCLHMLLARRPDADGFWTVILVTDYMCFAMLPWIQTRPPRALEAGPPWRASLRELNLGILHRVSIQMNTIPSGHAAEALACALLLVDGPPAVVALMLLMAISISAGALFGRYHYAIDIALGWLVALGVRGVGLRF
jgi:hypothetical protein